jgi:hypothetical protein
MKNGSPLGFTNTVVKGPNTIRFLTLRLLEPAAQFGIPLQAERVSRLDHDRRLVIGCEATVQVPRLVVRWEGSAAGQLRVFALKSHQHDGKKTA